MAGRAPVVGITLDHEAGGGYARLPYYALRENYLTAVVEAGGVPLPLPHEPALAARYLDLLDALVVTGGAFDVDPALFGATMRHPSVTLKARRTRAEWALLEGALARGLPVLAICGGMQLLNVVLGGTLIQHIPDEIPDALPHEQPNPRNEPGHEVAVVAGTRLHALAGRSRLAVNSAHHQAVARPGRGLVVSARAPDGVVEAVELVDHPFCLGVQWHPEYRVDPADIRLFRGLIEAARRPSRRESRS